MIGWHEIDVATRSDLFGLRDLILSTWILWTRGGRGDSEARDDEARSLVAPTPPTPRSLVGVSSGRHRRVIRHREPRLSQGGITSRNDEGHEETRGQEELQCASIHPSQHRRPDAAHARSPSSNRCASKLSRSQQRCERNCGSMRG